MGENSKIEWTDATFNPWIGCTKVDELCAHCYAEQATPTRVARKNGVELWGKGQARQRTSEANWKKPLKWQRDFVESGGAHHGASQPKVFCASLADWLDDEVPIEWLADLLKLIHDTPNLNWQLLTKRPENWYHQMVRILEHEAGQPLREIEDTFPKTEFSDWINEWTGGNPPTNVWIGTSIGTKKSKEIRLPLVKQIPTLKRFLSCEPLLDDIGQVDLTGIDWVIAGGESGHHPRPMHPDWVRSLRDQSQAAGVDFFFKQWGEWAPDENGELSLNSRNGEMISANAVKCFAESIHENGVAIMKKIGKKNAGRLLDGREWNQIPK